MNMSLAFFHGEQALVSLLFAALIALLGFPLLVYIWLRHTKVSVLLLALVYFTVTASACGVMAFHEHAPPSILLLTVFYIGFILTLPWNVISIFALYWFGNQYMSDREIGFVMLLGAGINTMLLYFLAQKIRSIVK
jgi:hypothetical protein